MFDPHSWDPEESVKATARYLIDKDRQIDLLLAIREEANRAHLCADGCCVRCDALAQALDAYDEAMK